MDKEEIINKTKNYVQNICKKNRVGHDWWHIERVYKNAMLINQKEKADEFIITMIVLMHDLYDHKFYNGNVEEALEETLKKLGVYNNIPEEDIKNIINSCENLGFSSNMVTKKELSIEGKIAQDADRLDGIGAIGIARTFTYGGEKGRVIYNPNNNELVNEKEYFLKGSNTSISHFYDKLLKLKDRMNTHTSKEIAMRRHKYMEDFLEEFFDEWNGKK
ncbi:MAG: HD domain-containing protein [Clostridia bacterium]|nr:HD domain-containing protein [Clostridia bacterium]